MVFPLSKDVDKEKIKHFWFALNKEVGDVADAQTKDLSRMYHVPARYKDAFNFIFTGAGAINYVNLLYSLVFMIVVLFFGVLIFQRTERNFIDTV